jgi:pyruvate/2-oxoglutarate dehydrogenase complex dihydrolipoamide acyltransferase (E2) component
VLVRSGAGPATSVGMWGIGHAYSPLAHYYRVPVLVLVGAVRKAPTVVDDAVVVRPMLTLTATFDHRYADGYHAARFAEALRGYCADPARFEPARPGGGEQSQDQVRSSETGS